jgi:hypothetical protein
MDKQHETYTKPFLQAVLCYRVWKLKAAGNVSSSIREQGKLETWIKPKNSKSRCSGSLLMMHLKFKWTTDSVCWKQTHWMLVSKAQFCW